MPTAGALIAFIIFAFLAIVLVITAVRLYNRLVMLKNAVAKAYANIDVLLQQRTDEVPNLITIVKGSRDHESATLKKLTELRASFSAARNPEQKIQISNAISETWTQAIAVIESYPNLKASDAFLALQKRMTEIENHIADRREFFNDSVMLYNNGIHEFPALIMAFLFGYREKSALKATNTSVPLWS